MEDIENRARFDIIRYANCWEDADILLKALQVKEKGVYLSIAAAGDNSLSILVKNPALVVAVDLSPIQLACVEIRKAAFLVLSYDELLRFLGVREENDRYSLYLKIRHNLSSESLNYWETHKEFIKRGIIHIGKFEHYFELFRGYVLPVIHRREKVENLFNARSREERTKYYREQWDSFLWRMLFRVFFSRACLGMLGRDPEFFKYVDGKVAERIRGRVEYGLTELPIDNNPYLEYILKGNYGNSLPFYLRKENYIPIRNNLDKLKIFRGSLIDALLEYNQVSFDGFNLSDIFEYMSIDEYHSELKKIIAAAKKGARLVYWNMLADRRSPKMLEAKISPLRYEAKALFKEDKAFFYQSLIIEEVL